MFFHHSIYFEGRCSVSQTPFSDKKNSCPVLYSISALIVKTIGLPCRDPTEIAVATSADRCTCCLF
jgi:hypothetical protein